MTELAGKAAYDGDAVSGDGPQEARLSASLIGPGHPYGDPGWCACPSCHDNCDHTPKENPHARS